MESSEITRLKQELEEAKDLINAIRTGEIDALAVNGSQGPQIFTLQSADQSYRLLVEKMNEGAIILSRDGTVLYSNSSIAEFLGISLKKLIGTSFFNLLDDSFRNQFNILFERGWMGHSRGEFMMRDRDGNWTPFFFSLSMMEMDGQEALGIIITNLSAKNEIKAIKNTVAEQKIIIASKDKELERDQEIKEEATRLMIILEGLPQMAWTALPNGSVNYYNQRWYDYTGVSPDETMAWGWQKVLHPEMKEENFLSWMEVVRTGQAYEMETLFRRADGQYRWHLVRARPIRNEGGEITLWVGTCTDIHDKKEALEQLALATEQLQTYNMDLKQKNEELIKTNTDLDNFLYLASHDLKAPISNIEGLLNAFFSEVPVEEEYQPMVEMMFSSVERFKRTILDLTEISKVHKDDQLMRETLHFSEVLSEIELDINDLIQRKKAVIHTSFHVPSLHYYGKILRSVLYNLVSNAIKYSKPDMSPEIHITTYRQENAVILSVKDNGLGLSKENLLKIFKMFNRIHTTEEGTGIGLYIVKRMIENVGGNIEVESEVGKGSEFRVFLK